MDCVFRAYFDKKKKRFEACVNKYSQSAHEKICLNSMRSDNLILTQIRLVFTKTTLNI